MKKIICAIALLLAVSTAASAAVTIKLRRDTAANWTTNSTVILAAGEMGVETDTLKTKIGDGVTAWSALSYATAPSGASIIDDTKGNGDTTYVWSADKTFDEVALKAPLASPVFTISAAIPQGTNPTVDAAGEVAVDTTSDQLIYYGAAKRVLPYRLQENFAIKSPVDADDVLMFKAQQAITITDIHVLAQGGGTISVDIQECDSAGANCATVDAAISADSDGAEDDGTLSNGAIDAGDWVKLVLAAPSGTVDFLTGSIYYTITAD